MNIMPLDSTPTPYFLIPATSSNRENASLLRSSRHITTGESIEIILIPLEKSIAYIIAPLLKDGKTN